MSHHLRTQVTDTLDHDLCANIMDSYFTYGRDLKLEVQTVFSEAVYDSVSLFLSKYPVSKASTINPLLRDLCGHLMTIVYNQHLFMRNVSSFRPAQKAMVPS